MPATRSVGMAVAVALLGLDLAGEARADEPTYTIAANVNDPAVATVRGPNLVWLPLADRRVNKLLVFLPSGGANNFPTEFKWVGTEGGRLGYHTIVLAYRNEVGINAAPPAGCGPKSTRRRRRRIALATFTWNCSTVSASHRS